MALRQTEAEFQAAVIQFAQMCGWLVAHFRPSQNRSGRWSTPMSGDVGFPDLVLARGGVTLLVELKSDRGRLTKDQMAWGNQIGAAWRLWRPADWPQIEQELRQPR